VCITGAPLSVVRAALMAFFVGSAQLCGRKGQGLHALAAATCVIGIIAPHAFFDIGFQLSAAATLGLILAEKMSHASVWAETLHATIAATICTLPLSIFYFGSTSAVALIANVVVVPMVPLLMAVSGAVYLFSFLPSTIAQILIIPCESVLKIALSILEYCARIPGSLMVFSVPLWAVIIWYLGVAGWAILKYTTRIFREV
jgi:competence protein ComEC